MWFNKIVISLLKSPLHFLMSKNTMLLTYTGTRSGKTHTTPVNYWQIDKKLFTASQKDRVWWRSLRKPAPVTLYIQREGKNALAAALDDPAAVEANFAQLLAAHPQVARYFKVPLDAGGKPDPAALRAASENMVFVVSDLQG